MKGLLTKYTSKRLRRLRGHLRAALDSDDQEILHQIRVEIKKIKAVLRLLDSSCKGFYYQKEYQPFRQIFQECGAMRDPHVMHRLMVQVTEEQLPPPSGNLHRLEEFRVHIPVHIRRIRKHRKRILGAVKKVSRRAFKTYLRKKRRKLKRSLFPSFKISQLHEIRKLIKEIWYLTAAVDKSDRKLDFYRDCAELIGDWHDKQILINMIQEMGLRRPKLLTELRRIARNDLIKLQFITEEFYVIGEYLPWDMTDKN